MSRVYGDEKDEKTREDVLKIWNKIYEIYAKDNSEDAQEIFAGLCRWFVFLDNNFDNNMEMLKRTVENAKESHVTMDLLKEMARLSLSSKKQIGEIYRHMVDKGIHPEYTKEDINTIINNLNKEDQTAIKSSYLQKGIYNLI